jgi:predicted alpha/beta hydrolase family esterase
MKKALLLHGTNGDSGVNWFPWLKHELEALGWQVWTPDLPQAEQPNIKRYNEFLFKNTDWIFDNETYIVGHSSGAVEALGLLQDLGPQHAVKQTILVGSFKDDLGWPSLGGLFETPLDFGTIKKRSEKFLLIHSDDDPYCPLDHAEYLAAQLAGTLKVLPGQKHFSTETDPKYTTFPMLLEILTKG